MLGKLALASGVVAGMIAAVPVRQRFLDKYRVLAVAKRGLAGGPVIRVTPGLHTRTAELDRLVAAITGEHRMFG